RFQSLDQLRGGSPELARRLGDLGVELGHAIAQLGETAIEPRDRLARRTELLARSGEVHLSLRDPGALDIDAFPGVGALALAAFDPLAMLGEAGLRLRQRALRRRPFLGECQAGAGELGDVALEIGEAIRGLERGVLGGAEILLARDELELARVRALL